jgi:PQQ-dependent catabolism-associated CXXCW motif protein
MALIGTVAARAQPPEPEGYRMDDYRAPTPATVAGGAVIQTDAAYELWKGGTAVWIDVLPAPRRPPNLPEPALWMPIPRYDIPGSLWLPDVGRGALSPELERSFRDHLEAATKGGRDTAVVFYCLADCWMSWNATKRALGWGFSGALWYEEGTSGWEAAGLPLAEAHPAADEADP